MFKGYKKLGEIIQEKRKKYFHDIEDFYAGIEKFFGKKSFLRKRKKNKISGINFSLNTYKRIEKGQIQTVGEKTIEQIAEFLSFIQIKKQEKYIISSYEDLKLEETFQNTFHEFKNEFYKAMREDENPLFTDLRKYIGSYYKLSFSVKNPQNIFVSKLKIEFSHHEPKFNALKVFLEEEKHNYEGFIEKIDNIFSINVENMDRTKKISMMFQSLDEKSMGFIRGLETSFNSDMEIFSKKTVIIKYDQDSNQIFDTEKKYKLDEILELLHKNELYKINLKYFFSKIFDYEILNPGVLICKNNIIHDKIIGTKLLDTRYTSTSEDSIEKKSIPELTFILRKLQVPHNFHQVLELSLSEELYTRLSKGLLALLESAFTQISHDSFPQLKNLILELVPAIEKDPASLTMALLELNCNRMALFLKQQRKLDFEMALEYLQNQIKSERLKEHRNSLEFRNSFSAAYAKYNKS